MKDLVLKPTMRGYKIPAFFGFNKSAPFFMIYQGGSNQNEIQK